MHVQTPNMPLSGENLDNTTSPFHPLDLVGKRIKHLIYFLLAYPEISTGLEEARTNPIDWEEF